MPDLPDSNQSSDDPLSEDSPSKLTPHDQPLGGGSGSVFPFSESPPASTEEMKSETPPWREASTDEEVATPETSLPSQEEASPSFVQESVSSESPSSLTVETSSEPQPEPEPLPENQPEANLTGSQSTPSEKPPVSVSEPLPAGETEAFNLEKRSPFKTILLIILVLLVLGGIGWAVFRFLLPGVQQSKEVSLTYWGLWEPESVMREVLTDWEKDHPNIKISYSRQSHQEYRERLQSALARGQGPDIFRFHNTWLPMFKNELEPVPATVMDAATYDRSFYPVASSSLRSGVNYLGIPLGVDTLALFYNEDIFTAAGVNPPETWDELRQLASQLTLRSESGKIQRAGVALGTTGNIWHWSDILGLMMLQNGADLANPVGSLAEDTLTFYTLFSQTDRVWDETLPASMLAFATGKTAMFFGFSWDVFEIKNVNPDLNFKIVPVPQLPGTDISWASFWVEGVSQKSENKEAAWEFLKFLSSQPVMEKLYQAESKLRLFGEPYSRVEMAGALQADPLVAPFVSQAAKAQTGYLCSRTFDNGLNDRMIKYFEDAVNAVNNGKMPKEALAAAANGVAQVLSQYGLGAYTVR